MSSSLLYVLFTLRRVFCCCSFCPLYSPHLYNLASTGANNTRYKPLPTNSTHLDQQQHDLHNHIDHDDDHDENDDDDDDDDTSDDDFDEKQRKAEEGEGQDGEESRSNGVSRDHLAIEMAPISGLSNNADQSNPRQLPQSSRSITSNNHPPLPTRKHKKQRSSKENKNRSVDEPALSNNDGSLAIPPRTPSRVTGSSLPGQSLSPSSSLNFSSLVNFFSTPPPAPAPLKVAPVTPSLYYVAREEERRRREEEMREDKKKKDIADYVYENKEVDIDEFYEANTGNSSTAKKAGEDRNVGGRNLSNNKSSSSSRSSRMRGVDSASEAEDDESSEEGGQVGQRSADRRSMSKSIPTSKSGKGGRSDLLQEMDVEIETMLNELADVEGI